MQSETELGKLITPIVHGVCYYPDFLTVREKQTDGTVSIVYEPHMDDLPVIIGQSGRQVRALRFVAERLAKELGIKARVDVQESYEGNPGVKPSDPKPFPLESLLELLEPILVCVYKRMLPYETEFKKDGSLILIVDVPTGEIGFIMALADLFYPLGIRNGLKVKIRVKGYRMKVAPPARMLDD